MGLPDYSLIQAQGAPYDKIYLAVAGQAVLLQFFSELF